MNRKRKSHIFLFLFLICILNGCVLEKKNPVDKIELDKTSAVINVGDTIQLTVKIFPDNASNKNVIWSSDTPAVVSVDSNGKVTALLEGKGKITAKTEDGEKTAQCNIQVDAAFTQGVNFKAEGDYLKIWKDKKYREVFLKSMNIGIAVPGKLPGEANIKEEQYNRWFEKLKALGINSIRIYTLHNPEFYKAIYNYNKRNPLNPIYVFHGIWLDERKDSTFEVFSKGFEQEIKDVIDAVYGKLSMPQRYGKAYGEYTYDISQWVFGWVLGREIAPNEVSTINSELTATGYTGEYFKISDVNPTTAWLVKELDNTVKYEKEKYKNERPVSFSSWPTLDPLHHPSEKLNSVEDKEELELYKIEKVKSVAGYFASYHAYPYYPDFINNDEKYKIYSDEYGKNPYIGYLTDLKSKYKNIPLFIAEYAVPSSWGNAKFSDSGMNHGGHSEEMQGIYAARLLQNIYDTKCAGGGYFSLFDEWWKTCWINEAFSFPKDRYYLWHDVTNPEENYGLITFQAETIVKGKMNFLSGINSYYVDKVYGEVDFAYFYLDIFLKENFEKKIYIAFDTYGDINGTNEGEKIMPIKEQDIKRGAELLVDLSIPDKKAQLYVAEDYDLFGIWHMLNKRGWHPEVSTKGKWNKVRWKNNDDYTTGDGRFIPATVQEIGNLGVRYNYETESNLDAVILDWRHVRVRLPWSLLQFSDPSKKEIMYGDKDKLLLGAKKSDGIGVSLIFYNTDKDQIDEVVETEKISWDDWDNVKIFTEKDKKSFEIFGNKIKSMKYFME